MLPVIFYIYNWYVAMETFIWQIKSFSVLSACHFCDGAIFGVICTIRNLAYFYAIIGILYAIFGVLLYLF